MNSNAFATMAMYAFVIKDARQCLDMTNPVQVYKGQTLVEQRVGPAREGRFDKRIVFGFLKGSFTVAEMNSFFEDFADCAGVAPKAEGYFKHLNQGLEVQTGGLSIQKISELLPPLRDIVDEFTNGKLLDEATFYNVKQTWFDELRNCHAWNVP